MSAVAAGKCTSGLILDGRTDSRTEKQTISAGIVLYVLDHRIIGHSKASKGKGMETATATTTTRSVFSVLETEGTAFVGCRVRPLVFPSFPSLSVLCSRGRFGAGGLASASCFVAFGLRGTLRITGRGCLFITTSTGRRILVIISSTSLGILGIITSTSRGILGITSGIRVISLGRFAICGHGGLENRSEYDNVAKNKAIVIVIRSSFSHSSTRATYVDCIIHRAVLRDCNEEGRVIC